MLLLFSFIGSALASPVSTTPINETTPVVSSDSLVKTTSVFFRLSASLQDDATTLWTNPANFAFAPAITKGLAITQRDGNTGIGLVRQVGVLGYGVHYSKTDLGAWWSASSALALRLDEHLSLSTTSTWHSIEVEDDSFVEWDIGAQLASVAVARVSRRHQQLGQSTSRDYTRALTLGRWFLVARQPIASGGRLRHQHEGSGSPA